MGGSLTPVATMMFELVSPFKRPDTDVPIWIKYLDKVRKKAWQIASVVFITK